MAGLLVVKVGGSLVGSPELGALLAAASRAGAIVVPGGGRFADAVRDQQARIGFCDAVAHEMAILAMDQTALLMKALSPTLELCATREELGAAGASGLGAIWRPSQLALSADLPRSWETTSDSLAIWLGIELGASRALILKSTQVSRGASLEALSESGVVDAHAPILARRFAGEIEVVGPATATSLSAALASPVRRAA